MKKPHSYELRPEFGSDRLLMEFTSATEPHELIRDLLTTCAPIKFQLAEATDLWMNDEVLLEIQSNFGNFTLSKDIWSFVFLLARDNQAGLQKLDTFLKDTPLFERITS